MQELRVREIKRKHQDVLSRFGLTRPTSLPIPQDWIPLTRIPARTLSPQALPVWKPELLHNEGAPLSTRCGRTTTIPSRMDHSKNEYGCDYNLITRKHSLSLKNNKSYNKDRQTIEALKCESETRE